MNYDYECSSCKAAWEAEQSIHDDPAKICPRCGQNTARRMISGAPWIYFKGWGWSASGYDKTRTGTTGQHHDDHRK